MFAIAGTRRALIHLAILLVAGLLYQAAEAQNQPRRLVPLPSTPSPQPDEPATPEIATTELTSQGIASLSISSPSCAQPWSQTSRAEIDLALGSIANHSSNATVRDLVSEVLSPGIPASEQEKALMARRLELLLGHARLSEFDELLRLLPPEAMDDSMTGLSFARTMITGGDIAPVCGGLTGSNADSVEWRMVCAAAQDELATLNLQRSVAADRGLAIDPAVLAITGALLGNAAVDASVVSEVETWPAAILLRTAVIDDKDLQIANTPVAASIFLAENESLPPQHRQAFVAKAADFGFGSSDQIALSAIDDRWALLENETVQSARVQLIRDIWANSPLNQRATTAGRLGPYALAVPVDQAFVWGAEALAPIHLSIGQTDRALAWLDLVERSGNRAGMDPALQQRLESIAVVAGRQQTTSETVIDPYILALLAAFDPDQLVGPLLPASAPAPSVASWLGLEKSQQRGACSASLAHTIGMLGQDPKNVSPLAIYAALRSLLTLDHEDQARSIAISVALSRPLNQ